MIVGGGGLVGWWCLKPNTFVYRFSVYLMFLFIFWVVLVSTRGPDIALVLVTWI